MKLIDLVEELTKKGLAVTLYYNKEVARMEGTIQIGSKTGTGTLLEREGKLLLYTRYGQTDEVNSYDDIAEVAFRWYNNYKDREPFGTPDSTWINYFLEKGWIKAENKVVYKTAR